MKIFKVLFLKLVKGKKLDGFYFRLYLILIKLGFWKKNMKCFNLGRFYVV